MDIKPPDSTNWVFDDSIYQHTKFAKKTPYFIQNKPTIYNDNTYDFVSDIIKNYQLDLQTYILHILNSYFGKKLDISDNTLIHLIYDKNMLIGLICSEYDENIQKMLSIKGWHKHSDMNCVSNGVYLYNFIINPNYRGRGVGTILINYLLDKFKKEGCRLIHLQVDINNKPGIRFFEKNKFIKEILKNNIYLNYKKWLD